MNIVKQYRNAKKLIQQVRNGEWKAQLNASIIYTATRGDKELWVASGPAFLKIDWIYGARTNKKLPDFLGIWRWYAWYAAVRKFVKDAAPKVVIENTNDW